MDKKANISVILPVFNMGEYVLGAIESVQQQTYTDWELIIVDDASTDGCENLVRSVSDD